MLNVEDQINKLEEKDAAKEQAGRKMFEALADIVEQFERTRMRVPADLSDSIRIFGKQALNAGREAGWGQ